MNTASDILAYTSQYQIRLAVENGNLIMEAPENILTDEFVTTAKQHKAELLEVLTKPDRWDPELAAVGYQWCLDCRYLNEVCIHPDNPFRQQCPQAPRKCQWYETGEKL
ncbi:MAG TPA: hypothetical protein EYQ42_02655 [Thiotrichaceae bacterium]|jgi:hypothetical protein|nr:hypothetical protein [Thiotrichaceae bacterium]